MFPRRRRITSKIVRKTRTKICVQFIYHSMIVIYDSRAAIYTEVTRASQQYKRLRNSMNLSSVTQMLELKVAQFPQKLHNNNVEQTVFTLQVLMLF